MFVSMSGKLGKWKIFASLQLHIKKCFPFLHYLIFIPHMKSTVLLAILGKLYIHR